MHHAHYGTLSDSTWPSLRAFLKPEQEIEAVVLGINREEQKISLGVRQFVVNPWIVSARNIRPAVPRGGIKGKIRNLTSYGVPRPRDRTGR